MFHIWSPTITREVWQGRVRSVLAVLAAQAQEGTVPKCALELSEMEEAMRGKLG